MEGSGWRALMNRLIPVYSVYSFHKAPFLISQNQSTFNWSLIVKKESYFKATIKSHLQYTVLCCCVVSVLLYLHSSVHLGHLEGYRAR